MNYVAQKYRRTPLKYYPATVMGVRGRGGEEEDTWPYPSLEKAKKLVGIGGQKWQIRPIPYPNTVWLPNIITALKHVSRMKVRVRDYSGFKIAHH